MFLNQLYNHRKTLSFRLTLWYALIFTLTSLLALSIFYYRISRITMENTDDELMEEFYEFAGIMDHEGRGELMAEFELEILEEAEESVFFRLISPDGEILKSSDMKDFSGVTVSVDALAALQNNKEYVIETISLPGHEYSVQAIYGTISPDIIFNMGMSLEDNYEYLSTFRNLIFMLMIPLFFIAAFIGWFLARHALKGVEEVTQTAIEISKGAIDKRVEVKRRLFEIDRLANTFNGMLDRIQSLIKGMREMNDNVAHDLRSPLTRIRGIAEMTLMGKESIEDYNEMAASTIEECDKLIEIINTMMDITETEAGVSPFKSEKLDIVELILSACELFDPIAKEKEVQLVTVLPDRLFLQGDKSKLQRLITNLLENAIKYNRHGGTVTISVNTDNHHVNIRVEDTGLGIAEEELSHIFERFYRCDRSRSLAGIGLGLSLAKAIAKAFNGDIRVQSVLDQGSSFQVILPA
ncbi:MAG: HAMP domain-containing protein [Desulfobacteraceae bacterium]|nr:HAMP domain-containing protein [Desulfobacteraceae bacterium]MBC2754311.1 HAMP domain-containing protein [Desulfobacteraceae bacterium]